MKSSNFILYFVPHLVSNKLEKTLLTPKSLKSPLGALERSSRYLWSQLLARFFEILFFKIVLLISIFGI